MKNQKTLLLALSASLLLVSCNNSQGKTDSSTETASVSIDPSYKSSVKNYLKTLTKIKNYTLKEEVSSTASSAKNSATVYYGEDFYYYDASYTLPYGYISCADGVYRIHENGGKLIGGELALDEQGSPYKTLWNDYFFYSFADLEEESIDAIASEGKEKVAITGKKNRLALLDLLGLGSAYYGSIVSFYGTVNGDDSLSLSLSVNDTSSGALISVKASVSALGSTFCGKVEEYREKNSYFVIDEDFAKARALMKSNNYTHYYTDEEDDDKIVGTEVFNENYYFVEWDSSYAAKMASEGSAILYSTGLIGIRNKKIKDSSGNYHTLNGSYLISLSGGAYSVNLTNYYNESPDIPSVYSYPSLLQMWDEVELFEESEIEGMDKAYVTEDITLIEDFVDMFFLSSVVASVVCNDLSISWKNLDSEGEKMICFTLDTTGGSLSYEFYHFGSTFIPALDLFLEDLE